MLKLINVAYRVAQTTLLQDVSIQVQPGTVTTVIGQNGAGKSTLLKLLAGDYQPTTGKVVLDGVLLSSFALRDSAKRRAVLPQSSRLNFPFRVHQVVMMGRSPHSGQGYEADHEIVQQALQLTDAAHLADRLFPTLSGGEKQRVQLARVLTQIWPKADSDTLPRYLLLDEPTSALDLAHQHNTLSIARQFACEFNVGVLAVLHDFNLAACYSDRIAVLAGGQLLCQGTPTEVLTPQKISQAFAMPVQVIDHPGRPGCPLVVANARVA